MAQVQRTGTSWIPMRRLLYLAGHLHMLRDQGKDGSKQLPRGYYHRKAHEKKKKKWHTEGFAGGKGNHFRHRKTKPIPKGELWTKAHENPVIFQKTSRYAVGEALPAHRVHKELPNGQTSFSLCVVCFGDSRRGVAEMSDRLPVSSEKIPPQRKMLIMGPCSRAADFVWSLWQAAPFLKKDAQKWTKGWSLHVLHGNFYSEM